MYRLENRKSLPSRLAWAVASAVLISGLGAAQARAQAVDAETYENVIRPQLERDAAAVAEIHARPPNWDPGEIRSNGNYGAIAWYEKAGGDYGYIVARGFISPTSADVQMRIECDERRVTCEGNRVVANQWLAIGRRTDIVHYVTAAGQTRGEAEALVAEQCRADGGSCTLLDVFDINPHRRGMSHLRPRVEQR